MAHSRYFENLDGLEDCRARGENSSPARPARGRRVVSAWRRTEGQAIVEFTLVVPLLLLVLLGIFKLGILFNHSLVLTDAVRVSARQLAVERGQPTPCADASTSFHSAGSGLSGAADPTYSFSDGTSQCSAGLVSNTSATVTATYPCDLSILGVNFAPGCQLSSSTTVRIE